MWPIPFKSLGALCKVLARNTQIKICEGTPLLRSKMDPEINGVEC